MRLLAEANEGSEMHIKLKAMAHDLLSQIIYLSHQDALQRLQIAEETVGYYLHSCFTYIHVLLTFMFFTYIHVLLTFMFYLHLIAEETMGFSYIY